MLPTREFIIALDNDTAGIEGTYKIIRKLNTTKVLKILQYNSNDKRDINDLGAEVLSLPLKNIL